MVNISGFCGYRYNPEIIDNFDSVLAPPYDVISPQQRDELYEKSTNNAVRVILSKGQGDEKYKNASETFNSWIKNKVLLRDEDPSIYVYHQVFKEDDKILTRRGFIATVRLDDFSNQQIYPHERTFSKPKADRLKLITASKANLSPIFSVYPDPDLEIEEEIEKNLPGNPIFKSVDKEGVENYLWKISSNNLLSFIADKFKNKKLLIADGHHRYETALNYRNIRRNGGSGENGKESYEHVMMFLSSAEQQGLIVKPTYRLVGNLKENHIKDLLIKIENEFISEHLEINTDLNSIGNSEFGLLTSDLHNFIKIKDLIGKENKEELGVVKLHDFLLDSILEDDKISVKYTKSLEEVFKLLKDNSYQLGFILPNINAVDIFHFAESNRRLPQKTTYFYPKVLSGLVFNLLD